jgi:hypothetical protein
VTRFLPDGANCVWVCNVRELWQSDLFQRNSIPIKQNVAGISNSLLPYGIDLFQNVDRAVLFWPGGNDPREFEFFWLFQGSFNPKAFEQAMAEVKPTPAVRPIKEIPNAVYYAYPPLPGMKHGTFVAMPNAGTLVLSNDERYVINAWVKGTGRRSADLMDKEVQSLLENVEGKPTLFLVVGGSFGSPAIHQSKGVRVGTCGFQFGEDVQAEYTLRAVGPGWAQRYKQGQAVTILGELFQYFGLGDTGALLTGARNVTPTLDEGSNTVSIHARYSADTIVKLLSRR